VDVFANEIDASSATFGQVNDTAGTATLGESVASGSVTLASGTATIDTGVGVGATATFYVALGPDTDDADVAADIRAASGGNYEVDIQETDTAVENPTINYDVVRVR
jgi:X-X-X-Leu-X-X-Gly heptad repeat protein